MRLIRIYGFPHIHRHDGLNHDRVGGHLAVLDTLVANVIQQQHTCLVARQQLVLPCLVLDGDAHTVTVGGAILRYSQMSVQREQKKQGMMWNFFL